MIRLRHSITSDDVIFFGTVVVYAISFLAFFPATWAIDDESNILSLATALSRGEIFLDRAGIDLGRDLSWHGHLISKFSPFHAALLVPATLTSWRLAFLWGPLFVILGAFVVKAMLRERGLSSGWVVLYFLCPGLLYYSRTLLAAVPAGVMGLCGAWLLFRRSSRPVLGVFVLSLSVLLHIWMAPFAAVLVVGWWLECRGGGRSAFLSVILGVAPGLFLMAWYNNVTTGSPFLNAYWLIGHQTTFSIKNAPGLAGFYATSLLLCPPAGWAVVWRRWAGNRTFGLAAACVLVLASLYYYRDGRAYGLAGWVPGQRFLIPASLLAVVPAAAALREAAVHVSSHLIRMALIRIGAIAAFVAIIGVSYLHQEYLKAHLQLQDFIAQMIPEHAEVLASDHMAKEFSPVRGDWRVAVARSTEEFNSKGLPKGLYLVWLGPPGSGPPSQSIEGRRWSRMVVRSWIFKRDAWIGVPIGVFR